MRRPDLLLVDNYDSFTHNLVDELEQLGARVRVVRHDAIGLDEALHGGHRGVVLSPGPGRPEDAGVCVPLLRKAGPRLPVLGVCLGEQALGLAHGARVVRARRPLHGTATPVRHARTGLLAGLPQGFLAARYHSLVVSPRGLPPTLEATAWSPEGEIMALRHRTLPQEGVQFHPESYLTPEGPRILAAFVQRCGLRARRASAVVR